jgi:hypothetical protein
MNSKFDEIYNQVLSENTVPSNGNNQNPNIAKDVQEFFAKHQNTQGFFDILAKQIEAAQKAQQQAQQQAKQQPAQQNTQQPAQQNNQQNAQQPAQPNAQQQNSAPQQNTSNQQQPKKI